jgi:putative FmdB family regulatory protein
LEPLPLYEYECEKDGRFERIQRFSDPPLEACPTCGQPVQKLLSPPAIQFKGSGWYVTDYARKGSEASSKDGQEAKGKDGSSSSKPDSAPQKAPSQTSTAKSGSSSE